MKKSCGDWFKSFAKDRLCHLHHFLHFLFTSWDRCPVRESKRETASVWHHILINLWWLCCLVFFSNPIIFIGLEILQWCVPLTSLLLKYAVIIAFSVLTFLCKIRCCVRSFHLFETLSSPSGICKVVANGLEMLAGSSRSTMGTFFNAFWWLDNP